MASQQKVVLVLPDVGLPDDKIQGLAQAFQNQIVGTLKTAGATNINAPIIVVIPH